MAQCLHYKAMRMTPTRHLPLPLDLGIEDTPMPSRRNEHAQLADAIAMLKIDHRWIKDMFAQYEATPDRAMKRTLAAQIFVALDIHAQLEEPVFDLAIRPPVSPLADTGLTMRCPTAEHKENPHGYICLCPRLPGNFI